MPIRPYCRVHMCAHLDLRDVAFAPERVVVKKELDGELPLCIERVLRRLDSALPAHAPPVQSDQPACSCGGTVCKRAARCLDEATMMCCVYHNARVECIR